MSYAPCKNPNCRSYGQPHPNCKCYGEMAEGGDVVFCDGPHEKDCEFYAEGGQTPDFDSLQVDEPKFDDLKADTQIIGAPDLSNFDALPNDDQKYKTPDQMDMAQLEGMGRGLLGPGMPLLEKGFTALGAPNMAPEDQAGRKSAWPEDAAGYEAGANLAGLAGGLGIPGVISKIAPGSKIVANAIQAGLLQTSDEVSNAMLGQGDPEHPYAYAALRILGSGAVGGLIGAGGQALENVGGSLGKFVTNIKDEKNWEALGERVSKRIGELVGGYAGAKHGGMAEGAMGALLGDKYLQNTINKYIGKPVSKTAQKVIVPMVIKAIGDGSPAIHAMELAYHGEKIARGASAATNAIENLFKAGSQQAVDYVSSPENRKKVEDWLTGGGQDQEVQQQIYDDNGAQPANGFAKGGEVKKQSPGLHVPSPISQLYPDQNMLHNAAKGRISNYLNSLRPSPHPTKLPFDSDPDTRTQKKAYHQAIDIANNPLGVLNEIKKGTILPDHIKHFASMYPEVNNVLKKQITDRITKSQLDGDRPSHIIRQGLSMFMGASLSAESTPANIQAAQAVFANKGQPPQQGGTPPKSTAKLSKSDSSFLTGSQALARRGQKV